MPIVFSAVACNRNMVANFAACDGNFTEIAEQVLSKLPSCNNKMTYSHGIYLLHYIAEDDYLFLCITNKLCQRSRAFLFLNEIQRRFKAGKQSKEFTEVLAAEMYRYSEDYSTIVIRKGELDELNGIGVGCSESILGEKILYINNPDNISYSTITRVTATPGIISLSVENSKSDTISDENHPVVLKSPKTSISNQIPDVKSTVETISEAVSNLKKISSSSPRSEQLLDTTPLGKILSSDSEISLASPNPVISPRLLVVIIGVVILIIGMAVYAFGPVSCVVVTSIGIYSLLRFYSDSKDKPM